MIMKILKTVYDLFIIIYTLLILIFLFTPFAFMAIVIDGLSRYYIEKKIKTKELKEWEQ